MNAPQRFSVQGMKCEGCQTKIETALLAMPQVKEVAIDLKNAQAEIEFYEPVSLERLNDNLAKAGQFQLAKTSHNFFTSLFNF